VPWGKLHESFQDVELFAELIAETGRAYYVRIEDETPLWVAKSIASWDGVCIKIPRWLAVRQKLIGPIPADDDPVWENL
jgi:hypothetical protein